MLKMKYFSDLNRVYFIFPNTPNNPNSNNLFRGLVIKVDRQQQRARIILEKTSKTIVTKNISRILGLLTATVEGLMSSRGIRKNIRSMRR